MGIRLVLALWVALLALAGPAAAQTAKVGDALSTCVARVAPGDTPAAMLVARERFDCDVAQRGLGEGDYWVIARTLPADNPYLGLDQAGWWSVAKRTVWGAKPA